MYQPFRKVDRGGTFWRASIRPDSGSTCSQLANSEACMYLERGDGLRGCIHAHPPPHVQDLLPKEQRTESPPPNLPDPLEDSSEIPAASGK